MLRIVVDDHMTDNEVAAIYQEGEDAVILVRRGLPDDQRVCAMNALLARLKVKAEPIVTLVAGSAVASLLLVAHLLQQVASPPGQFF